MPKYRLTARKGTDEPIVLEATGPANDALLSLLFRLEIDHAMPVGRISISSFKFEEIITPPQAEVVKRII